MTLREVKSKPFYLSRTMIANGIIIAIGAGGVVLDYREALNLPDQWATYMIVAGGVLNVVLRSLTRVPVTLTPPDGQ